MRLPALLLPATAKRVVLMTPCLPCAVLSVKMADFITDISVRDDVDASLKNRYQ